MYAWSIFNSPLTKQLGVVAQAADDWALQSVLPIFSFCAVSLGLCTAFLGPWAERSGPRKVAVAAATCWASGLMVTGVGCLTHTLPLCYLGYGVLGGAGWGVSRDHVPRRGIVCGLCIGVGSPLPRTTVPCSWATLLPCPRSFAGSLTAAAWRLGWR